MFPRRAQDKVKTKIIKIYEKGPYLKARKLHNGDASSIKFILLIQDGFEFIDKIR